MSSYLTIKQRILLQRIKLIQMFVNHAIRLRICQKVEGLHLATSLLQPFEKLSASLFSALESKRTPDSPGECPFCLSIRLHLSVNLHLRHGRTDGQTRTATTSTAIAAVTPCRRSCDSSTVSRHKRVDERTNERTDGQTPGIEFGAFQP